jgi:hypothetical protein
MRAPAAALGDDEVGELARVGEAPLEADRPLVERAVDAAHGGGDVLQLQRLHHLPDAHAVGLERVGAQEHRDLALDAAEHLHLGHARDRPDLARDARVGEVGELGLRLRRRRERERDDRDVGVGELLDHRLLHLGREVRPDAADGVADLLRGLGEVLPELELDDDAAEPVVGLALHLLDPGDGRDLLLDRVEDLLLDAVGARARVRDARP